MAVTLEELELKIAAAQVDLRIANENLRTAERCLNGLYVARTTLKYGLAPGMTVVDRRGRRVFVDKIRPDSGDHKPWLYGRKYKTDGGVGNQITVVYGDWTIEKTP